MTALETILIVLFVLAIASWLLSRVSWAVAVLRLRRDHPAHWEALGRPGVFLARGHLRSPWRASFEQWRAESTLWLQDEHARLHDARLDAWIGRYRIGQAAALSLLALLMLGMLASLLMGGRAAG